MSDRDRYHQQLACQHEWSDWKVPYWNPKRQYRSCINCDKSDSKYIVEPEWRNGSIDDRM